MKTLAKVVAAVSAIPVAAIIALAGAGSAFASCTNTVINGVTICVPNNGGGVTGGGTGTTGGSGGGSTVPGQAGTIVGGGSGVPQQPPYMPPAPAPAYNPPPAKVAPAPAPAPAYNPPPAKVAPIPAQAPAPIPAAPNNTGVNTVEPPVAQQGASAIEHQPTEAKPEPSKPAVDAAATTPSPSQTPTTRPTAAVESSAPVTTADATPSSSPENHPEEIILVLESVPQTASVSPLLASATTVSAALTALLLFATSIIGRISIAKSGSEVYSDEENP